MNWLTGMIGLPLVTSPLVYIAGSRLHLPHLMKARWLALLLMLLTWLLFGAAARDFALYGTLTYTVGAISFHLDGVSLLISGLALGLGTLVVVFSSADMAGEVGEEKYYAMALMLTGTIIGLVCAGDLFNLWVWFETMAISSYLLVAFYREKPAALRACIRYLIQTASGSILVLFGIALVLMQTGTLDLRAMPARPSFLLMTAAVLFVMGFGVKLALVPSYTWLPAAYAEAPAGISALLSGAVTITGLIAMLRALTVIGWSAGSWGLLLLALGALNIVIGNLLALREPQIKRILAYSSISHIGFVVLAAGIGMATGSAAGMEAGMLHLLAHGIMKALAFLIAGALVYALAMRGGRQLTVGDLAGAAWRYPGMAAAMVLALLSLAGVPPLAGFFSKLRILAAGVVDQPGWMVALMAFAALNSVLSLGYYLPIVNALYHTGGRPAWRTAPALPLTMRLPVYTLAALLLLLGLWPGLADGLIVPAGAALLGLFGG